MNTMGRGLRVAIALLILIYDSLGSAAVGREMPEAATTSRVSVASDGTQANNASDNASITADGGFIAFHSYADNLVGGDSNGFDDVFVHDMVSGVTMLVSVASDGTQGNGQSGLYGFSISGDGRYVAFESAASNLVNGDTNVRSDIFVHDLLTGDTTRFSVASGGAQGDGSSNSPSISADGRYVAFYSYATNLVSGDTNTKSDIFLHNIETGETTRVSTASDGTQGDGDSLLPAISADGSFVAFLSSATNLVSGDANGKLDVFVHERESGETIRISVASDGTEANGNSGYSTISADGRFVAFESAAWNLIDGDTNGVGDIFVHDRLSGDTSLASQSSDGEQGDFGANFPSISADGRYVAFYSWATNLVPDDTNSSSDIFIHDREKGETMLVSLTDNGMQGNNYSGSPSISADGRYAAFQSDADNLVSGDDNGFRDIFVRDQGEGWFVYTISGTVTSVGGAPLSGVTINSDSGASALSGSDGSYLIVDVLSGTYTLTPSLDGFSFMPISITVSVPPDALGVDFIAEEVILVNLPLVVK